MIILSFQALAESAQILDWAAPNKYGPRGLEGGGEAGSSAAREWQQDGR